MKKRAISSDDPDFRLNTPCGVIDGDKPEKVIIDAFERMLGCCQWLPSLTDNASVNVMLLYSRNSVYGYDHGFSGNRQVIVYQYLPEEGGHRRGGTVATGDTIRKHQVDNFAVPGWRIISNTDPASAPRVETPGRRRTWDSYQHGELLLRVSEPTVQHPAEGDT